MNDIAGAAVATLTAGLIWSTRGAWRVPCWAVAMGLVGTVVAVVGAVLVIFHMTGWFLAGLVSMFGFAGVGLWLLGFDRLKSRLASVAGVLMAAGLIVLPGVVLRFDDVAHAPLWIDAGFLGSLGTLIFPVWLLRFTATAYRTSSPTTSRT